MIECMKKEKIREAELTIYILSDIHWDFYKKAFSSTLDNYFETYFLPADTLVSAGDFANSFEDLCAFLPIIAPRYRNIVLCLGNHDLTITWDKARFRTSEEKIAAIKTECAKYPNIHLLDGNCVELDGVKFGGTMGMWDYTFLTQSGLADPDYDEALHADCQWHECWFDGVHWNYCGNDIKKIRIAENAKLNTILSQKPDVVLTHFCPLPVQEQIPVQFRHDDFSTYFYYTRKIAKDYTASGKIWCAGHVHVASIADGIYVHPNGYPSERPMEFNGMKKENFLLEV